jgi:hypothetical protein
MRDTIDMAREVKATAYTNRHYPDRTTYTFGPEQLETFVALVRADEREQAIALQQHEDVLAPIGHSAWGEAYQEGWAEGTAVYRDTIRARGQA